MRYREILEACWSGYQQQGMKKKGNRMVPNCVPVSEQDLEENLRKWFKEKWVRFGPDGKIRGDCARGSSSEGKPKCLPQSKAQALGKKGRASAAAKKRREDPNPERRGPAKNVATKVRENEVGDLEKVLQNPHSYNAIDHMMQSIAKKSKITAKQLHDRFVAKHNKTPDDWIKNKGKK
jgi:ABC-type proline/glycine betaine transport system substrate-binding protein